MLLNIHSDRKSCPVSNTLSELSWRKWEWYIPNSVSQVSFKHILLLGQIFCVSTQECIFLIKEGLKWLWPTNCCLLASLSDLRGWCGVWLCQCFHSVWWLSCYIVVNSRVIFLKTKCFYCCAYRGSPKNFKSLNFPKVETSSRHGRGRWLLELVSES